MAIPGTQFDAFAARATAHLHARWHMAERSFGPHQISNHGNAQPIGLELRLDGPQLRPALPYTGPILSEAQFRAHVRPRPESMYLWVVPRSYRPKMDFFLQRWFTADNWKTHHLGSTAALDLYAYGGDCYSWTHWKTDIKRNLPK